MTAPKPPGPNLDELNARIAEAREWGDEKAESLARWQKEFVKRQWAASKRKEKRAKGRG